MSIATLDATSRALADVHHIARFAASSRLMSTIQVARSALNQPAR